MDFEAYRDSLQLLSRIIQLFSLTRSLSRKQWEIVRQDLWSVIVNEISILLKNKATVQIIDLKEQKVLTTSSSFNAKKKSLRGAQFNLGQNCVLFIDAPLSSFTEEEKTTLWTIADHIKTASEWREALEKGFEVQKRIKLLHKITVSIRGSLELSEVLAKTAKDLGESLQISRCFIRRYDPLDPGRVLATEQEYVGVGFVKAADLIFDFENEWMKNLNLSENENHVPEALYIPDVNDLEDPDGLVNALAEEIGLVTFLGVPLIYKGTALGSLCFHQCLKERHFDEEEMQFIRQVADEATGAIVHAEMYQHIQQQARTDSLTGLYNKSYFHDSLDKELERCKRNDGHLSLMMIDLDFLKRANDNYGHIAGDEMIKLLGVTLKQNLRQIDIISRFGGDEFGALLVDTPLEGAKQLGTRVVDAILKTQHPTVGNLSASIGVAGTPLKNLEKENFIELADQALYLAKRRGKGRVCFSDDLELAKDKEDDSKDNSQADDTPSTNSAE